MTDETPKRKGGRPRYFDPTPEQAAAIREIWQAPLLRPHAVKRASEIVGKPLEYHHLRDWYARVTGGGE